MYGLPVSYVVPTRSKLGRRQKFFDGEHNSSLLPSLEHSIVGDGGFSVSSHLWIENGKVDANSWDQ